MKGNIETLASFETKTRWIPENPGGFMNPKGAGELFFAFDLTPLLEIWRILVYSSLHSYTSMVFPTLILFKGFAKTRP